MVRVDFWENPIFSDEKGMNIACANNKRKLNYVVGILKKCC
jgi:hypothetical protein